jgi:hypothetical protein
MTTTRYEQLREQVFARDGYKCVLCSSTADLRCHHNSYIRHGSERPGDLTTLCSACHRCFHEARKAEGQYRALLTRAVDIEVESEALRSATRLATAERDALLVTLPRISDRARTMLSYGHALIIRAVAWIQERADLSEAERERQFSAWLGTDIDGLYEEAAATALPPGPLPGAGRQPEGGPVVPPLAAPPEIGRAVTLVATAV